jgi:hypothetical protein
LSRGVPPHAGSGYSYDWQRQHQKQIAEKKKKNRKAKKKMNKMLRERKLAKRKEPSRIVRAVEGVEKRIEQEKRHLEGIK